MQVRQPGRFGDLFRRAAGFSKGDVIRDGVVEEDRILGYDGDRFAQTAKRDIGDRNPVQQNFPAVRFDLARQ